MSKPLKDAVDRIRQVRDGKRRHSAGPTEPTEATDAHNVARTETFLLRGISAIAIDAYSDCPKKFDFFLQGREEDAVRGTSEAIDERVRCALSFIFELDPEERTHAAVEPALEVAWRLTTGFTWLSRDEDDHAKTEARRILHNFVENRDLGGHTTGRNISLTAEIETILGDVTLEAVVERIAVEEDERGVTLVAYDMGEPGEHKFAMDSDPIMRVWLLVATDSLRQPVIRIKNVFVKHDVEEIFEIRSGDIDVSRDALAALLSELRMLTDLEATPGPWCGSCGYRFICPECDVRIETERRIADHGGIV